MIKHDPNKITATLKLVVTGEFYDDEASEETLRYCIEQDLEDAGFDVDVSLLKDTDRIKVTRCKDCRYFEPSNAEEGDYSGYCRNDYAPCQNQTVDAWWFCGSAERVSE